jgi:transcriptional regulator with XRE-family HTH domain
MLLGKNIRSIRLDKGIKQFELAKKAGISISYLCEIENGKSVPSLKTLLKIAKALKVDCSVLIQQSQEFS